MKTDRPLSDRVDKICDDVERLLEAMHNRSVTPMLTEAISYLKDASNRLELAKDAVDDVYEALEDLSTFSNPRPDAPCGHPSPGSLGGTPYWHCELPAGHEGPHVNPKDGGTV